MDPTTAANHARLELLEQQITLKLQEIDGDFVKCREVASGILMQSRRYVQSVRELHDSLGVGFECVSESECCFGLR